MPIEAIIFDKDGTLFDLQATWAPCTARLARKLASGDAALETRLLDALGYDSASGRLRKDSLMATATPDDVLDAAIAVLPSDTDPRMLRQKTEAVVMDTPQVPAAQLLSLLEGLRRRGLALACVTNDSEAAARSHLRAAGVETRFATVIGYDSGHGAKPDPAPLRAIAGLFGARPSTTLVVGDSRNDMRAAEAAGMRCVGVLTGAAEAEDLLPPAEAVLPHVGHLPEWLDRAS